MTGSGIFDGFETTANRRLHRGRPACAHDQRRRAPAPERKDRPDAGRFFSEEQAESIPGKIPGSAIYGVYSAYESDASGAFDVTAGVAVNARPKGYETVQIEAGEYLVFEAQGPLPDAVIATWRRIWTFFEENPQIQRRYATDYEAYTGPESVAVCIGIR